MEFKIFKALYDEALEYDSYEYYVADRGWQSWMENYPPAETLERVWVLANGEFKQLRELSGLSKAEFGREYGIPINTVQNWETDENKGNARKSPSYVKMLLAYTLVDQ